MQAILFGQLRQRLAEVVTQLPVEIAERQLDSTVHQLHRLGQTIFPDEAAAQNVVGVHGRFPGLAESLGVECFDIHAHLRDVVATTFGIQGVEQHTLLHR
ncbi:hypothetical protein D3C77_616590 [compost metagenome]